MPEDYSNTSSSMQGSDDPEPPSYTDVDISLPYLEKPSSSPSSNEESLFLAPPPAPPTEEDQLAAKYQLGEVLKRYKSEPRAFTTDDFPSSSHMYIRGNRRSAAASMLAP